MSVSIPGVIFVFFKPRQQVPVFDVWRAQVFGSIPQLMNQQCLTAIDDIEDIKPYRFMNICQVENVEQITESFLQGLIESCKDYVDEMEFQLYKRISFDENESLDNKIASAIIVSVGMTPINDPFIIADYHKWYVDEHIGYLSRVPGWRTGSRYSFLRQLGNGKEYAAPFVAIHEYEEENGLGGEVWKASVTSAWSKKIQSHLSAPTHRRVWKIKGKHT